MSSLFTTTMGVAGPRLVFLHGLFGQGKNWMTVARMLADSYRIVLVDLPNHGRSAWSDTVSYAAMAEPVAELLAADGSATVVGHSMGGKVAMTLALNHPDLVDRLVVADMAPVRYPRMTAFATFVAGMRALDLEHLPDRAAADRELQPYVEDPVIRSFLLQNLRRDGSGWRWQHNLQLLGDHLAELGDWPEAPVAAFTRPVLWLAGARSDYVQPAYAETMRQLFPRVRLVTIKDAGHWLHAERPDVFAATLRGFVHP